MSQHPKTPFEFKGHSNTTQTVQQSSFILHRKFLQATRSRTRLSKGTAKGIRGEPVLSAKEKLLEKKAELAAAVKKLREKKGPLNSFLYDLAEALPCVQACTETSSKGGKKRSLVEEPMVIDEPTVAEGSKIARTGNDNTFRSYAPKVIEVVSRKARKYYDGFMEGLRDTSMSEDFL